MTAGKQSTMLCGTAVEPGVFALLERNVPDTAPDGQVLIDVAAVGICGTDYHIFEGKHPFLEYPRVMGHEVSGRVLAGGPGTSITAGTPVIVNPYLACGTCGASCTVTCEGNSGLPRPSTRNDALRYSAPPLVACT